MAGHVRGPENAPNPLTICYIQARALNAACEDLSMPRWTGGTLDHMVVKMAVLGVLGLSACAVGPAGRSVVDRRVAPSAGRVYGRVVAVRALALPGSPGALAGSDPRDTILGAIGAAGHSGTPGDAEYIVSEDDGRTISVVQTDARQVRLGQRVALIRGLHARLAPADR
jgi:outer membrane lipoprotein SlyB